MVKYKHEAEFKLKHTASLMEMIFCPNSHIDASQTAVEKAQLKYDALVQLMEELMQLDGVVLPQDLASRIENKQFEAQLFYYKPNA